MLRGGCLSIVNICITKDRALVGCDTACLLGPEQGGVRAEMTKMMAFHRIGVVMAYRGESHMFKLIFAQCFFVREPESFDDLVDRMPEIVRAARSTRPEKLETDLTLELYVVGWSSSRGRMAGAAYTIDTQGGLTNAFVDTWLCASSPGIPGESDPKLESQYDVFEHARKQTEYAKNVYAEYATGGRFLIADITYQKIKLLDFGCLDD